MKNINPNRRHIMTWAGNCYACICRVCNLKRCRQHTLFDRCVYCNYISDRAIIDCDQFESKYQVRVFKIKRSVLNKRKPTVPSILKEILQSLKDNL